MSDASSGAPPAPEVGPTIAGAPAVWRGTRNEIILASGPGHLAFTAAVGTVAMALIAFFLWRGDYPTWRILTPAAMFAAVVGIHSLVLRRARRHTQPEQLFLIMNLTAQVYMIGVTTVTGGVYSPILPVVGAVTVLPVVLFGLTPVSRWLTITSVLLFVAMAAVPPEYLGPRLPADHYATVAVIGFVWTTLVVTSFVRRVYNASMTACVAVDTLSEERVAVATEQMGRLQSVGAKVAHELKNPLASVKGLVQLLARREQDARSRERLEVVQSEIARMEAILAEYLSFSRPLEDLAPRAISLDDVVRDAVAVVAGRAEQGRLALTVEAQPVSITADPRRLKEALLNLLANAIEATAAGGAIGVTVRGEDGGGVIEVRDSGRGIKPEELDRLGTSFFTTRDGGTGLGVVLASTVVAQHGGSIHYASAPGRGTTVTVRLPATPGPAISPVAITTSRAA